MEQKAENVQVDVQEQQARPETVLEAINVAWAAHHRYDVIMRGFLADENFDLYIRFFDKKSTIEALLRDLGEDVGW